MIDKLLVQRVEYSIVIGVPRLVIILKDAENLELLVVWHVVFQKLCTLNDQVL